GESPAAEQTSTTSDPSESMEVPQQWFRAVSSPICPGEVIMRRILIMRYLAAVLFVAFISFPCFAQDSEQYRTCNNKANTQGEMNACANKEAARVDAELNDVYRALLSKAESQPEAIAKIKAAERAWIAYRDAYVDAMYPAKDKQAEYGSV